MGDLALTSLRGGMNDTDVPGGLAEDQCALALNTERFLSMVGERRLGCEPFLIQGSGFGFAGIGVGGASIIFLGEDFPNGAVTDPQYWGIAAVVNGGFNIARQLAGVWFQVVPTDDLLTATPTLYQIRSENLAQKKFFAYLSDQDRLHVWDGTHLRRTGLAQPEAPTAADEGSGTFTTKRYYRMRVIEKSGPTILRRSEPSFSVSITPSGSGAGVTVTRGSGVGEGENYWELEASLDDAVYYRLATLPMYTLTFDDTTPAADGYNGASATDGTLSEEIGVYLLQHSAKLLLVDADRLVLGGHWTNPALGSRVSWTPVSADPGVGNDERIPLATGGNNFRDLDPSTGGDLTDLGSLSNGTWYAFKWSRIYKMARTGDVDNAYLPILISDTRGALPGSVTKGLDESGRACLFFLDPAIGPCSLGASGLRDLRGFRRTWQRVHANATIPCRVAYYPDKSQVHWWVAADGADTPTLKFVLQVTELRTDVRGGTMGGWSLANGTIAEALAVGVWHEYSTQDGITRLCARPFIGLPSPDFIQRCDVGDTDAGDTYLATIQSRPIFLRGLLNMWEVMEGAVLATASATAGLVVSLIRDFLIEVGQYNRDVPSLAPIATELYVVKVLDDLVMGEAILVQYQFQDRT